MQEGILALMQRCRDCARRASPTSSIRRRAASPPPTRCSATCSWPSRGASSASPVPASSSRPFAKKIPRGLSESRISARSRMVDMVVHRHDLRATIARLCRLLMKAAAARAAPAAASRKRGIAREGAQPAGAGVSAPRSEEDPPPHPSALAGEGRVGAPLSAAAAGAASQADRSFARSHRAPSSARSIRNAISAGDCRRRQGLDDRFYARDPRSGRQTGARLHVTQSGSPQRALSPRTSGGRNRRGCGACRYACRMRGQEWRRADHGFWSGGVSLVLAPSGGRSAPRSRARRPS